MTTTTDDSILKQDMPQALHKVNGAAKLLEEAAKLSRIDPFSKAARAKLIEGSRLILQGTSNVLMVFDESEVRKIIGECKRVLDYLAVSEVIETMEDLVQFVKDMSPRLSQVRNTTTTMKKRWWATINFFLRGDLVICLPPAMFFLSYTSLAY